jgi:hypothetical protein
MERLGCAACTGLGIDQEIRTPGELRRILLALSGEISRGALEQEPLATEPGLNQASVQDLLAQPYPDVLRTGFRCTHCGQCFQLSCETHHGSGGRWSVQRAGA